MKSRLQPILRIATRKSPLALWQANYVRDALEAAHPELQVEVMGLLTEGDKLLATPLVEFGGKGLFVKELELALFERHADIAVHSIKDMPVDLPDDFALAVVCEREDPRDVFVSNQYRNLAELPHGAKIGTSSSRRSCQLKALRSDLQIENLRGNVGTRLRKLDEGRYDAIILAAAGLKRLNQESRISSYFEPDQMLPAVGQGAIGIECRSDNREILQWISVLEDKLTRLCITAERAMNQRLMGGCQLPIAALATIDNAQLKIRGLVGDVKNNQLIKAEAGGLERDARIIGEALADDLLQQGAARLLLAAKRQQSQ